MNSKIQYKYDKISEQFFKISSEYSISKEKIGELFTIIEGKTVQNDYEEIFTLFIKKYLFFSINLVKSEIDL